MSVGNQNKNITFVPITQSDTTVYNPPLHGLYIFATGDVSIVSYEGDTITRTFPTQSNGGSYPFKFEGKIRQVLDTNTTANDADLLGYR